MSLFSFLRVIFLFFIINLPSTRCNVDFQGSQVADVSGEAQWTQGIPGDGYFAKQPNAYLAVATSAKVSVGTLSTVWLNENSVLSMDEDSQLTTENWGSMHIYGRMNLGKRSVISGGRYVHFATYSNRTVSLGDDSQIKLDYWASVYILDNFFIGGNSRVHCEESSRIRVSACEHPACVLGDETRLTLRQSSAMEISGTLILLNAANITVERMARFTMEANTSLAAGIPHPSIHVGEQSVLQIQKGTHCLLLDSLVIPDQTTFALSPGSVDERVKCFNSVSTMRTYMKLLAAR